MNHEQGRARGTPLAVALRDGGDNFGLRTMRDGAPAALPSPGILLRDLRAATRGDQVALDTTVLRLNFAVRDDYGLFLRAQCAALASLESDWREEDGVDFSALLRSSREDLSVLKIAVGAIQWTPRAPLVAGQRLGVAYVVRGSRSAVSALRHRVSSRQPSAYLDLAMKMTWPHFLGQLDPAKQELGRASSYEAIRGARLALESFSYCFAQARV